MTVASPILTIPFCLGPTLEVGAEAFVTIREAIASTGKVALGRVVLSKRESKSRPNAGLVEFQHTCLNQNDEVVATCKERYLTVV